MAAPRWFAYWIVLSGGSHALSWRWILAASLATLSYSVGVLFNGWSQWALASMGTISSVVSAAALSAGWQWAPPRDGSSGSQHRGPGRARR